MSYHDFVAPDTEGYIRAQYVQATGKIIEGPVLAWYLGAWASGPNGPRSVLIDIWENKHFTDHAPDKVDALTTLVTNSVGEPSGIWAFIQAIKAWTDAHP